MHTAPIPTIEFAGGAGTVTGSKFLVSIGPSQILVDCGMFQGWRELRERNWEDLPFDVHELDAVVLTHAHVDHCGMLPLLVKKGFHGPIYVTPTTAELVKIVLPDCGHLNEEEAEHANRRGWSRHAHPRALFTEEDARRVEALLRPVRYGEELEICDQVQLRLSRAGHILGAASAHLKLAATSVVFSGDLGRANHPLLVAPDPLPAADYVVVESTYGDRAHETSSGEDELGRTIERTIGGGGSVLVPAFAVDRTEVILHHLAELTRRGAIPHVPVYVDSPMALSALDVYRAAMRRGDPDIRPSAIEHGDPFAGLELIAVPDVEGSKALNHPDRPCIIVSAAGMATGGRVVHHLAHMLADRRNAVVLVGYQCVGTRGHQLAEGATEIKLLGEYVPVRAAVAQLPHFSVHADASELLAWVGSSPTPPRGAFVVHGEPAASNTFARAIRDTSDIVAVAPTHRELVTLASRSLSGARPG